VIGMAGNVADWTATSPARDTAVVRGGSWQMQPVPVTNRQTDKKRELRAPDIGFRCAADIDIKP
jgi:formylglycine-generating enzyme required for sulfatase activity